MIDRVRLNEDSRELLLRARQQGRFCVNCKHHTLINSLHICQSPDVADMDMVTGTLEKISCNEERSENGITCGPEGHFFMQKAGLAIERG